MTLQDKRLSKVNVNIAQYFMRQSFEEGFRSAGGSGISETNPNKGKWFDYWMTSQTREILVANGVISGDDNWR